MFASLTKRLVGVAGSLARVYRVSEKDVSDAIREVRLSLLDADVNYTVVKEFISEVKEKALVIGGIKGVSAGDRFIEILHEELVSLMTTEGGDLAIASKKPSVYLLCGLQGSGKTTSCAKLAFFLKEEKRIEKILLVPCDLKRPGAVEQLRILSEKAGVSFYNPDSADPVLVSENAKRYAIREGFDAVLFDTAGRLHADEPLMNELKGIKSRVNPDEVLFVANAALGQDAAISSEAFDRGIGLTGFVLTMLDGDARAGASLSMIRLTGKPIKLEGSGEKIQDLRLFSAESMADRILGKGDTVNFVREAKKLVNEEEANAMAEKIRRASFDYNDYLKQIALFRKMGPFKKLMRMLPGNEVSDFDLEESEKKFMRTEAIIFSMTPDERVEKVDLCISRIKRIASGSGASIGDINKLKKQMKQAKEFFKDMNKEKMEKLEKKMMGGNSKWL
ncbi:MAG: signal recognition particle protein [Victivallaceae bacterium]